MNESRLNSGLKGLITESCNERGFATRGMIKPSTRLDNFSNLAWNLHFVTREMHRGDTNAKSAFVIEESNFITLLQNNETHSLRSHGYKLKQPFADYYSDARPETRFLSLIYHVKSTRLQKPHPAANEHARKIFSINRAATFTWPLPSIFCCTNIFDSTAFTGASSPVSYRKPSRVAKDRSERKKKRRKRNKTTETRRRLRDADGRL